MDLEKQLKWNENLENILDSLNINKDDVKSIELKIPVNNSIDLEYPLNIISLSSYMYPLIDSFESKSSVNLDILISEISESDDSKTHEFTYVTNSESLGRCKFSATKNFFENFNFKKLISKYPNLSNFVFINSYLDNTNLLSEISDFKSLSFIDLDLDLDFLEKFTNLDSLYLNNINFHESFFEQKTDIKTYKFPKIITNSLKKLKIDHLNIDDFSFLKDFLNLKKLYIFEELIEPINLNYDNLIDNLETLCIIKEPDIESSSGYNDDNSLIEFNKLDNLFFINNYQKLKELRLSGLIVKNVDGLFNPYLENLLESLTLSNMRLPSINFLKNYTNLKELSLDLYPFKDSEFDYSIFYDHKYFLKSLEKLDLGNIFLNESDFSIDFLLKYKNLKELNLNNLYSRDIFNIMDCEFVMNGSLKELTLGKGIDWSNFKNGETVRQLKKQGVKVQNTEGFYYVPETTKDDKILSLLRKAGIEDESALKKINDYDVNTEIKSGFSSKIILSSDESIIKIAKKESIDNEKLIYSLPFIKMKQFMPKLKEYLELENSSMIALNNVNAEKSGFSKSGIFDPILHNLYIMGLFHKEATQGAFDNDIKLHNLVYETLTGEKHYDSLIIPLSHFTKQELRDFNYNSKPVLVEQISPIINDVCSYIKEQGDVVVHGDWKLENFVNGHILDFGISHIGKEAEDISYFLSEMQLALTPDEIEKYVDKYISLRSSHDSDFADSTDRKVEIKKYFNPIRLKELSVRASVRRKRIQSPENSNIKRYYMKQMNDVVQTLT